MIEEAFMECAIVVYSYFGVALENVRHSVERIGFGGGDRGEFGVCGARCAKSHSVVSPLLSKLTTKVVLWPVVDSESSVLSSAAVDGVDKNGSGTLATVPLAWEPL